MSGISGVGGAMSVDRVMQLRAQRTPVRRERAWLGESVGCERVLLALARPERLRRRRAHSQLSMRRREVRHEAIRRALA